MRDAILHRVRPLTRLILAISLAVAVIVGLYDPLSGADQIIKIGLNCDRSGPTQTIGPFMCPGFHDYVKLINKKGGVLGHTIEVIEIDSGYNVPRAVEAYQRFKREGVVSVALYGTPMTYVLTPSLNADKIPGTAPGFGMADAADGTRFPYIFPIAATYWSQAAASIKFILDNWDGDRPPRVAYLFYDNPGGREPIPVLEKLAEREGIKLRQFAVPPPGIEMSAQVLDITQRFRADWVIGHLFGRGPSVSIKELKRAGFPISRLISYVWGSSESDAAAAGWEASQGYHGLQFAGAGNDYPVIQEIVQMYEEEGKEPPAEMKMSVYYNRGVLMGALHVEAIRNALEMSEGDITGEDVKAGFERIKDFTLSGLLPPLEITPEDHEGGGWVRIYQIEGEGWVPVTDWFKAYRDVIEEQLAEAAKEGN